MSTPDNQVAEKIGRAIDGQIFRLQEERAILLGAAARIAAIDAELVILQQEKARIDDRRPPHPNPNPNPGNGGGNGNGGNGAVVELPANRVR